MPAAANIVLNDATPAAVTFEPTYKQGGAVTSIDKSSLTSAGQRTLYASFSPATANRPTNRINFRLAQPKEVTIDGVTSVVHVNRINIDVIIADDADTTERADLSAFFTNLAANSVLKGYISTLSPQY